MFKVNVIGTQSEITSLIGDIALYNGKPAVHAHINLAAEDGTVHGGHLLEAHVRPTLEVILVESPQHLQRKTDAERALVLIEAQRGADAAGDQPRSADAA